MFRNNSRPAGRPWAIAEQTFVDVNTKLRFEFTSAHSQALASGDAPPDHDQYIMLNVYNETGNKVIRLAFERGDLLIKGEVESFEPSEVPAVTTGEEYLIPGISEYNDMMQHVQDKYPEEVANAANLVDQAQPSETLPAGSEAAKQFGESAAFE